MSTSWNSSRLILVAVVGACGGDGGDDAPPVVDELTYQLFDSTILLDEATLSSLVETTEDGTLRFDGTPAALAQLERFEVLLAPASESAPKGLMRLVASVETDGNGLVVRTLPAPVQLAFRSLHVKFERTIDGSSESVPWVDDTRRSTSTRGLTFTDGFWPSKSFDEYPINGDGDTETPYDQVHMYGQLGAGFKYTFSLDVDWGDVFDVPGEVLDCLEDVVTLQSFICNPMNFLPEAKVGFAIDAGADAELNLEGITFLPYSNEYVLGNKKLDKIQVGPLTFFPEIEIIARISGEASSAFELSVKASASARAKVSFSSKSGPTIDPPTFDRSFSAPSVFATLTAEGKVAVGPRLHLRLFDFAGPYASLLTFAEVTADSQTDPCWRLTGGVEGDVGFDIVTPDLAVVGRLTLASFGPLEYGIASGEVATGACEPLTTGPGGGQAGPSDQAAFANPTFEPWARSYGGVVEGFPFEGPGAQIEWSRLTPTIDGRFMLTGSDTKALVKLGTDGSLIWAKRYLTEVPFWLDTLIPELLPGIVVNTDDAAMLVVTHPYVLLKVDTFGTPIWAQRIVVDVYAETWLRLTGAVPDGQGGFFVAGTYGEDIANPAARADGWLMRFNADGESIWSKRVGDPTKGNIIRSLLEFEDGFVVAGSTWDPALSRWTPFAHRYDRDGNVVFQKDLVIDDCQGGYVDPGHLLGGLVTRDGDLIFAVRYTHQGYVSGLVRFKPDGSLAWSSHFKAEVFAHLGPEITAVVELPTGGYLAAGSYSGGYTASDWFLAGLDALGRPTWSERMGGIDVPETIGRDEDGYPSLLLTNDGGVIVGGYSEAHAVAKDALVAMKMPAKNGSISFGVASEFESSPVAFVPGDHCIVAVDANLPPVDFAVPIEPILVTAENVTVEQRTHTP